MKSHWKSSVAFLSKGGVRGELTLFNDFLYCFLSSYVVSSWKGISFERGRLGWRLFSSNPSGISSYCLLSLQSLLLLLHVAVTPFDGGVALLEQRTALLLAHTWAFLASNGLPNL